MLFLSLVFAETTTYFFIKQQRVDYHFSRAFLFDFLKGLKDDGYVFLLPRELGLFNNSRVVVLVHDCDYRIGGVDVFVEVERLLGIRSAFFLRVEAEYFPTRIAYFKALEREGWEVGFHYDVLSRTAISRVRDDIREIIYDFVLARQLFVSQVSYLRSFFNLSSTRYHGDVYNLDVNNRIFYERNLELWKTLNLQEVSSLDGFSYVTDVDKVWRQPKVLGDKVLVNLHSDWWSLA